MKVKLSQYVDVDVPPGASMDEIYEIIDRTVAQDSRWRKETDFCIDEVDDSFDHEMVGEMVG